MKLLLLLSMIVFNACSISPNSTSQDLTSQIPGWIYNPNSSGKTGGVGSCKTHIGGKTAQRKLAISRAIDEIAGQQGVKVDSGLFKYKKVENGSLSSNVESYSFQKTDGTTVVAYIKEMWYDRKKDELYVWMVQR